MNIALLNLNMLEHLFINKRPRVNENIRQSRFLFKFKMVEIFMTSSFGSVILSIEMSSQYLLLLPL